MFLDLWQRVVTWLRRRRAKVIPAVMEECPPVVPPPPDVPPVEPDEDASRFYETDNPTIRFYEKQRLKHDKFVTPQGELPERIPRPRAATQEVKPRLPAKPEPLSGDVPPNMNGMPVENIVDQHHEGGEVLYKMDELLGEFNFRDTVLQQLERYFFYLKRMKRLDKDAYHLYRQVGASLLPYLANGSWHREISKPMLPRQLPALPPRFNQLRPSFGCFAYGADPETEKFEQIKHNAKHEMWVPKFMYYQKYKMPPSSIQPMGGGDVYTLTMWWDRPDKKRKYGIPQEIPIHISADGKTLTALKVIETRWKHLGGYVRRYAGYKKSARRGTASIPQRAWKFPEDYREWAKEHDDTVEHFLTGIFLDSIIQAENSHMSMTRIAVTKGDMTAVFSVNIRRTAYFFQDRDISVTQGGTRKPIFHMVAPHVRKDGTAVKMHFRGLSNFTWAGYRVHISIPGLDHLDINDIDIGMADEERMAIEDRKKMMTQKQLGAFLAEKMRKGWKAA